MKKINWLEWKDSNFLKAKQEKKPILLDIHGTWCHWCHVMDKETYSNSEIISFVNKQYIAIKVDTDQRPDINERYNMGGWPTTAILTPKGSIITGGTYLPAEQMMQFLSSGLNSFHVLEDSIDEKTTKQIQLEHPKNVLLDFSELIEQNIEFAKNQFDVSYGGFGAEPKFPMVELLNFLNYYYFETKDEKIKEIIEKTLSAMCNGGMYDKEEFGFYRYSTTRDWSIPHYEKMLEDNSQLVTIYLNAYSLFGKKEFLECAKNTLKFLTNSMYDNVGNYFYGTKDADEHYYSLKLVERKKEKSPFVDKTLYTHWNCLMISALFRASIVIGEESYKETALKCFKTLKNNCFNGKDIYHYFDKQLHF